MHDALHYKALSIPVAADYGTHGLFTSHQPTQLIEYSTVSNKDLTSVQLVSNIEFMDYLPQFVPPITHYILC